MLVTRVVQCCDMDIHSILSGLVLAVEASFAPAHVHALLSCFLVQPAADLVSLLLMIEGT